MDKTKYCSFIAFVLILVTLFSWNSMSLSAKYVSTTPEICIFRNFIQTIIPTRLFISHVEGGTGATKKGTTLTLTPTADNQKIKVTITNPTEVVYYYSGVTSNENITLTEHSITK